MKSLRDMKSGHGHRARSEGLRRRSRAFLERLSSRWKARPLRSAALRSRAGAKAAPLFPGIENVVMHRLAFGPAPGDHEHFLSLGADDESRLEAWVDEQLDPDSIDESELQARLAASNYTTLDKSLNQLWVDHELPENLEWDQRMRPFMETQASVFLRAVYAKAQLAEVLVDFWHNHFNIYGWHYEAGPVFVHYDREVIRANFLGSFRQMLEDVTASTSMLYYLDNVYSQAEGPNENFAREVLELHALGEENYLGAIPAASVPAGDDGLPIGYVDEDVRELARCLTGWSVDETSGEFLYRADWHDPGAKTVLGLSIPAGLPPLEDVRRVFDRLAVHQGVAQFISGKLCRRLVSDHPPQALVDQVADVFHAGSASMDQLKLTVRSLLLSDDFKTTWGEKIKNPFERVVSAMRAMNPDFSMDLDVDLSNILSWLFSETGRMPFEWRPPTGYPDSKSHWIGSNPLVMGWRFINTISNLEFPSDSGIYPFDVLEATPGGLGSAEELAEFWINRCLGREMTAGEGQEIVDFMAQGHLTNVDLGLGEHEEVQTRLRTMVALILNSPESMWR